MMLYAAADLPLPTLPFDVTAPAFNVRDADRRDARAREAARAHLTKPHVYLLGAHTGCACGFSYGVDGKEDEEADGRESVRRLAEYLEGAVERGGPLELYACWDGDEPEPPVERATVTPRYFGGDAFALRERWLATVVATGA